ncbi:MAG: PAS domain S-box protein [Elusimicrobia bacterium]|nr:PAS domain S-box protein [Elusimicrobiota bacterium]
MSPPRTPSEMFKVFCDNAPVGFTVVDRRGRLVYANAAAAKALGYSRGALLRRRIWQLDARESKADFERHFAQARKGRNLRFETKFRRRNGKFLDVGVVIKPFRLGRARLCFSTWSDISGAKRVEAALAERERALEALRESERRYWTLVDTTRVGYVVVDVGGRVVDANREYARLAGRRRPADIRGRRVLEWTAAHDLEKNSESLSRCTEEGRVRDFEVDHVDRRGRFIPVEINATVVRSGGRLLHLALCRDISRRRRLEQSLLRIGDRERRAIGRDLHDDLGQQLTGIALMGRALQARLRAQASPEAGAMSELLRHVDDALRRTRELSRGLASVPTRPDGLAESLAGLAAHVCATSGVDCRLRMQPGVLVADPVEANHLHRIAQEAVHNAVRHGRPRVITVGLTRGRRGLRLSVADDGRGLRAAAGRKAGGGMGLGIMRHRARLIHGSLSLKSRPGRGTQVVCVLPGVRSVPGRGGVQSGRPLAAT